MTRSPLVPLGAGLLLALTLSPGLPAQEPPPRHDETDFGFSVQVPAADWQVRSQARNGLSSLHLVVEPKALQGLIQFSVRVEGADPGRDAAAVRDSLVSQVAAMPDYDDLEVVTLRVGERDCPGLEVEIDGPGGSTFRLQQAYLVEQGMRYVLQCHAPSDQWQENVEALHAARDSFVLLELSDAARAERSIDALAARCGTQYAWAGSWEEAVERARAEKKLILVRYSSVPGFQIADSFRTGTLMDPDLGPMLDAQFVLFAMGPGVDAPLREPEHYGMSGTTFGSALLAVTPDARLIEETAHEGAYPVLAFLRDCEPELPVRTPPAGLEGRGLAAWHAARGSLEIALELLLDVDGAASALERARLWRLLRRADEAHRALDAAASADDGALAARLASERWRLLLGEGRVDEARAAVRRAIARHGGTEAADEARALLGILSLDQEGGADRAREIWGALIADRPESPWAWQAANLIDSPGLDLGIVPDFGWPSDATLLETGRAELAAEAVPADEALAFATRWLQEHQQEDGSWMFTTEVGGKSPNIVNTLEHGLSTYAGRVMLQVGDHDAAGRLLGFLRAEHDGERERGPMTQFMDYTVWAHPAELVFYADCLEAGVGDRDAILEDASWLVERIAVKQRRGGGWTYYISGDPGNVGEAPNETFSFVTANMLLCLLRAQEAGIEVPPSILARATEALANLRDDDGDFAYRHNHDSSPQAGATNTPGAAGREPLCTLALVRRGVLALDDLERSIERFFAHHEVLHAQRGKNLMHAGSDGEGSHYVLFDYLWTSEAIVALPEGRQDAFRTQLESLILECRTTDGCFIDMPMMGRAWGTAAAALALRNLSEGS